MRVLSALASVLSREAEDVGFSQLLSRFNGLLSLSDGPYLLPSSSALAEEVGVAHYLGSTLLASLISLAPSCLSASMRCNCDRQSTGSDRTRSHLESCRRAGVSGCMRAVRSTPVDESAMVWLKRLRMRCCYTMGSEGARRAPLGGFLSTSRLALQV